MTHLLISISIIFSIFSNPKPAPTKISLKSEINNSIIDGFFENDSTNVTKNTYFIK
jgi:hypothetical protein